MRTSPRLLCTIILGLCLMSTSARGAASPPSAGPAAVSPANPILFVAQVPSPATFATSTATFGNHLAGIYEAPRGGGLYIRYPDGSLKNLTAAAGFGSKGANGFQDGSAIAVRDPAVHWDGSKAIFSMVVGAPTARYQVSTYRWQLYEVSGLGQGQTPQITKLPRQPAGYNNISPIYGTDDRIIFTSDRPRGGEAHLYPQFDEYELSPVVSGLWSLNPASGDLILLDHAPSGNFTPTIDSYGRVIFTRWDHLQRDQEADADYEAVSQGQAAPYGTFNYASEAADAAYQLNDRGEVFPEPRGSRSDLLAGTNMVGHTFNFFGPWQVNEDGSEAETLNHIGRQEYGIYADASFNDDPNLSYLPGGTRANTYQLRADGGLFQMRESPTAPGLYYATNAREFSTHAAGQIVTLSGAPSLNADQMVLASITHPDTSAADDTPSANHSGLYRDPLPLSDGGLVAAHASTTQADQNIGSAGAPRSRYDFRLQLLAPAGNGFQAGGQSLTSGIPAQVRYWSPDDEISYSGPLWELQPVEVVARARPARRSPSLRQPELDAFAAAGVDPFSFKAYLRNNNLALAVSRNVTVRDNADRQQPFNLRVPGGVQTIGAPGKIYMVSAMQFFQADMLRGKGLDSAGATPDPGRRVLAQPMHDPMAQMLNAAQSGPTPGSVTIGADGSLAAFVPARRAMSWQMTDAAGTPVVRERIWVTFQPGEVRVCASCHGLNNISQAGGFEPVNTPAALVQLLLAWKAGPGSGIQAERVYLPALRR